MRLFTQFLTVATVATMGATSAYAQVPFRIASPANGASVRETARIQIPRSALGDAQYLTLTIDGIFRAGIDIPRAGGEPVHTSAVEGNASSVSLLWDTKTVSKDPKVPENLRIVQDGPHTLEIAAYNAGGQRVGLQTLTLNVNNKGALPSPASGILLSYGLRVGDRTEYKQKTEVEYIADPQTAPANNGNGRFFNGVPGAGSGGGGGFGGPPGFGGGPGGFPGGPGGRGGLRGGAPPGFGGAPGFGGGQGGFPGGGPNGGGYVPEQRPTGPVILPVQTVTANYERTVEDRSGAAFLVRDKALEGVIVAGNGAAARLEDIYTFKSRYRTVRSSGFIEDFAPASSSQPGAYIALPIIDISGTRRRVGEQWSVKAPVLLEWATLNKPPMVDTQNTLESLEWQDGYQTARISQNYKGKADVPIFGGAGTMKGADVDMKRTIWFAYRSGRVIRTETETSVSGNAPATVVQQMVPSAGVGGGTPGFGGGAPGFGGDEGGFPGGGGTTGLIGGGGFAGGPGAGFGGSQGTPQEVLVPAKFRSTTTVTLAPPKAGKKTVVIIKSRKKK